MANNQRSHSRNKTVGSGSAQVHTGHPVNAGSRPVGGSHSFSGSSGGHASYGGFRPAGQRSYSGQRAPGGKLSFKTLLIILIVLIAGVFVLKGMGDEEPDDYTGSYNTTEAVPAAQNHQSASYQQADAGVSSLARDKYVTPVGGGKDTVTIMVYMCGTDLESKYGMATKDLQEMAGASLSSRVNIIVETGGCKSWQTKGISNTVNQIYKVENGGLTLVEKDMGKSAMTDPGNLTDFIRYCNEHYPADRRMLILWNHGGGTVSGYGYDEKAASSSSMMLAKIDTALKNAGVKFDFIGFDACLMATLETDIVCARYADYLIASEETEPGTGWYYTNWLTKLSGNTSLPTVEIAENIINDYVSAGKSSSRNAKLTLSVVDLAELQGTVPDAFRAFASSTNEKIENNEYKQFSSACAGVRQFSQQNKLNQVDMIDLCERIGTAEAKNLAAVLKSCVKYNKTTISAANGISVFFPVASSSGVQNAVSSYAAIGIDSEYARCVKSFATLQLGGQLVGSATQTSDYGSLLGGDIGSLLNSLLGGASQTTASTSPVDVLLGTFLGGASPQASSAAGYALDASALIDLLGAFSGRSMPQEYAWLDTELLAVNGENIVHDFVDPSHITATEKNGQKVLALTEEEWSLISTVDLNVFSAAEDGYVDLGYDNVFEWTADNDLLLEYDGTWLTLNGNVCAYYLVSDTLQDNGEWITEGRIPALLNGQSVNLRVVFTEEAPEGVVTGAYPLYDGETDVQAKGDIGINAGDEITLLCDCYDLNGNYTASYTLGDSFIVPSAGLSLVNLAINSEELTATYRLTDIYGNHFWIAVE